MVSAEESWSTRSVPPERAFAAWSERLEQFFPEYGYQGRGGDDFEAAYRVRRIGLLSLVSLRVANAEALCRPWRSCADRRFEFKLVCEGMARFQNAESDHTLHAGDMILLDHRQPFRFWANAPVRCTSILLPEAWLSGRLSDPEASCFAVLDRASPWARTLGSFADELLAHSGAEREVELVLADQIGGLVRLAFDAGAADESVHRRRLVRGIIRDIALRHQDVGLNTASFAAANNISRRYLHSLLASAGTSFRRELTGARLAHARRMLEDPRFERVTIGDIAYRCGFGDPMHFSRRFREAFGMTPGAFRSHAAAPARRN